MPKDVSPRDRRDQDHAHRDRFEILCKLRRVHARRNRVRFRLSLSTLRSLHLWFLRLFCLWSRWWFPVASKPSTQRGEMLQVEL